MSTVGSEHVSNRYGENATHPCVMEDVNSKDKLDLFLGYADVLPFVVLFCLILLVRNSQTDKQNAQRIKILLKRK